MKITYDENSPITNNLCVLVEADENTNIESKICMESGYTTNDRLKLNSSHISEYESRITEYMKSVKFIDETESVWYPTFMQMPGGMLYCEPNKNNELQWKVALVVNIFGEERLKYPIPGKEGEYFTSRLDVENAKIYGQFEFKTALDELYSIVKEEYNED